METLQCMLERRSGGEGGIRSVRATRGAAFWAAMRRADTEGPQNAAAETPTGGSGWESGGWSGELMEACLSRSQQLRQVEPLQDGGQELTMCVHTCHLSPEDILWFQLQHSAHPRNYLCAIDLTA